MAPDLRGLRRRRAASDRQHRHHPALPVRRELPHPGRPGRAGHHRRPGHGTGHRHRGRRPLRRRGDGPRGLRPRPLPRLRTAARPDRSGAVRRRRGTGQRGAGRPPRGAAHRRHAGADGRRPRHRAGDAAPARGPAQSLARLPRLGGHCGRALPHPDRRRPGRADRLRRPAHHLRAAAPGHRRQPPRRTARRPAGAPRAHGGLRRVRAARRRGGRAGHGPPPGQRPDLAGQPHGALGDHRRRRRRHPADRRPHQHRRHGGRRGPHPAPHRHPHQARSAALVDADRPGHSHRVRGLRGTGTGKR